MTATPKFDVRQDEEFIFVDINVPYVRVSDMEFYIDGCDFTFYCKPYLLKLNFPSAIVDDDRAKAVYDLNMNHGTITVSLPKENKGEVFPDLDLLTKLLQRKKWKPEDDGLPRMEPEKNVKSAPLIEVLSTTVHEEEKENLENNTLDTDKQRSNCVRDSSLLGMEALLPEEKAVPLRSKLGVRYGFQNRYSNFFSAWQGELSEIIALPTPETTLPEDRALQRISEEDKAFDADRYLADLVYITDDPIYQEAISFVPHWERDDATYKSTNNAGTNSMETKMQKLNLLEGEKDKVEEIIFSEEEKSTLRELPNKEYLVERNSREERELLYGMIGIIIAYCYDHRMTQGDYSVESAWTISVLSPLLSWLDSSCTTTHKVVEACTRRILSYPYLRNYDVAKLVIGDAIRILSLGRRSVLRSFLQTFKIFQHSETQYLLCSLFLEDYCVWLQSVDQNIFSRLAEELKAVLQEWSVNDCKWDIRALEASAVNEEFEEDQFSSEGSEYSTSSDESSSDESSREGSSYESECSQ